MSTSPKKRSFDWAWAWLEDRYPVKALMAWAQHKSVPSGPASVWYYCGGITMALFGIQVVTGILLMFYYKGSADSAYESIEFIMGKVPFGWLIRSIHHWAANIMIFMAFVHMFSVFFMRSFQKPRELTWLTGIGLLFVSFGFGFSGYLLPWNELSFFATRVGTDMIKVLPFLGRPIMEILRGGEEVTGATLPRFFALHVVVFPLILVGLIGVHLLFVQIQGMHEPEVWKKRPELRKTIPFFPDFVLRDLFLCVIVLDVLAILAVFLPVGLGVKADPFSSAPAGIRPEWYFMYVFQALKFIPAMIGPLEGEIVGIAGFGFGWFLWILVPWIDRGKNPKITKILRWIGVFIVIFIVVMTVLGYVLE